MGTLEWTTIVQRGSGSSGGLPLDGVKMPFPGTLALPRSTDPSTSQPLTDPDLYLKELDISILPREIEVALREAVQCFRRDLYLACLAMLGRASEAAWIETGLALAKSGRIKPAEKAEKFADEMQGPFPGIGKKIPLVVDTYSKPEFADLAKRSGIKPQELKNCVVWADCVRDSRNSIHYGAEPAMSNSYEKVAALLIGAVPHIKILVTVTNTAKEATT